MIQHQYTNHSRKAIQRPQGNWWQKYVHSYVNSLHEIEKHTLKKNRIY